MWRSLKIACAADAVSERTLRILSTILENLTRTEKCYVPLGNHDAWMSAVRWAVSRVDRSDPRSDWLKDHDRELQVGKACRRLADRGYRIDVDTNGLLLEIGCQEMILNHINTQIERIGGAIVLRWVCSLIRNSSALHDGLWLLGNRVGNFRKAFLLRTQLDGYFPLQLGTSIREHRR